MKVEKMLDRIVSVLATKNVRVNFINNSNHTIEIGELRANQITINTNLRDNLSIIFTIAHLFGHYIQFRNYSKYKHLIETVEKPVPLNLSDDFRQMFWDYEKEAFGIGKSLMYESFPITLKIAQMYQIFMVTDFEHFWHYITTGKVEGIDEFNKRLQKNYSSDKKVLEMIEPIDISNISSTEIACAYVSVV